MVTGNGPALWLVIIGSAVGTGIVLWLLKLAVDYDASTDNEHEPADKAGQDEEPRLTWVLAWPTTGAPLHPLTGPACEPAPHANTTACTGAPLPITTAQPSGARHAKRTAS